eukprot:scaffold55403_cov100-Phaeocystis_antarctica.AAC.1
MRSMPLPPCAVTHGPPRRSSGYWLRWAALLRFYAGNMSAHARPLSLTGEGLLLIFWPSDGHRERVEDGHPFQPGSLTACAVVEDCESLRIAARVDHLAAVLEGRRPRQATRNELEQRRPVWTEQACDLAHEGREAGSRRPQPIQGMLRVDEVEIGGPWAAALHSRVEYHGPLARPALLMSQTTNST